MSCDIMQLVIFYLVVVLLILVPHTDSCHDNIPDDPLSFQEKNGPLKVLYVKLLLFKALTCCTTGYKTLIWYKLFQDGTKVPFPWYVADTNFKLESGNQTLNMYKSRKDKDAGYYICEASNDTAVINNTVHLHVFECEVQNGKISVTEKPTTNPIVDLGESYKVKCEGMFGCLIKGTAEDRIAQFQYQDKGSLYPKSPRNSSKFTVIDYSMDNGTVKGSLLEIKSVDAKDYQRLYSCVLQTPEVGSQTGFNFTIQPPEVKIPDDIYWFLAIPGVFLIFIIFSVAYYCNRPRVNFFINKTFGRLPDKGEKENDILLIYSERDQEYVQDKLKPNLICYTIFDRENVSPGQRELSMLQEAIFTSYSIVFVYSLHLLQDNKLRELFNIVQETALSYTIIVQLEKIPQETLDAMNDCDEMLKQAPSALTSVKWPWKDPGNKRKVTNFVCSLKNKLPAQKHWTSNNSNSSLNSNSSNRRLNSNSSNRRLLSESESMGDNATDESSVIHITRSDCQPVTQVSVTDSGISSSYGLSL